MAPLKQIVAVAIHLAFIVLGEQAKAEFLVSVNDTVAESPSGSWHYQYALANHSTDGELLYAFEMTLDLGLSLSDPSVSHIGWSIVNDDDGITFLSEQPDTDIAPGQSILLSFRSSFPPKDWLAVLDGTDNEGETHTLIRNVKAPGPNVPEPASIVLIALGGSALGAIAAFRRRRSIAQRCR